jgi:hypothetical protein
MKRHLCLAILLCAVARIAVADDPGMCKSLCASEQQACRKDAAKLTGLDKMPLIGNDEKNPLARDASRGAVASVPARIAEADDFQKRKAERTGHCTTAFQGCTRTCGATAPSTAGSEVFTKQGQAKRGAPAGAPL